MTGEPPPRPAGGPLAALALGAPPAVAAARLVAGAWLARAGLELAGGAHGLEGPVGRPLEALALACALPLLVGLALSRSLRRASGPARLLITEPVGWAAVAAVGLAVPTALGDGAGGWPPGRQPARCWPGWRWAGCALPGAARG